jgi:hypothetical protein
LNEIFQQSKDFLPIHTTIWDILMAFVMKDGKKISPAIKGVAAGEVSMIYNDGFIVYFSSQ